MTCDPTGVAVRDVLTTLGIHLASTTVDRLTTHLGTVIEVEELTGGVVHLVARLRGQRTAVVIKHRGDTCRQLAHIPISPDDIAIEAEALHRCARVVSHVVPQLICVDLPHHTLILEDLEANDLAPGDRYFFTAAPEDFATALATLATTIATIHQNADDTPFRGDNDKAFVERNLFERVSYHDTAATTRLANQVATLDRGFVLGDVSPKNLLLAPTRCALVDLEYAHRGPQVFDLAFLIAHALLHRITADTTRHIVDFAEHAIACYEHINSLTPGNRAVLTPLIAALMAYRLRNPVVPYFLPLTSHARDRLADTALLLVASPGINLGDLVTTIWTTEIRYRSEVST